MIYKIEYSVDDTSKVDTISYPAQMYTITELMRGTYYSVRMALNNSAGEGVYSIPATGRTDVDCECLNIVCNHGILLVLVYYFCWLCDKLHAHFTSTHVLR